LRFHGSTVDAADFSLFVLFLGLLIPSWAAAQAGVLEINQTCAVETGCFPGDDPGFPVTLRSTSGSHSFALTSDIAVASNQITAIEISRTNVTVDLRGFEIACREAPYNTPCSNYSYGTAYAGGDGIKVIASSVSWVEVKNGTINSMGDDGLELGERAVVRNVRVVSNGGVGISAGAYSDVRDCQVGENGFHGIYFRGFYGRAIGNHVTSNGATGIRFTQDGLNGVLGFAEDNVLIGNSHPTSGGVVGAGNYCGAIPGPSPGSFGC
jgi:hypothetical protein